MSGPRERRWGSAADAVLEREADQLGGRAEAELLEEAAPVGGDAARADAEPARALAGRDALRERAEQVELARREGLEAGPLGRPPHALEDALGDYHARYGLTRLRLAPLARIIVLLAVCAGVAVLLVAGTWNDLSILKEYGNRADSFWREAGQHVLLAFGSLLAAALVGIPLGILCHRVRAIRTPVLNVLNIVQTVPSIALTRKRYCAPVVSPVASYVVVVEVPIAANGR